MVHTRVDLLRRLLAAMGLSRRVDYQIAWYGRPWQHFVMTVGAWAGAGVNLATSSNLVLCPLMAAQGVLLGRAGIHRARSWWPLDGAVAAAPGVPAAHGRAVIARTPVAKVVAVLVPLLVPSLVFLLLQDRITGLRDHRAEWLAISLLAGVVIAARMVPRVRSPLAIIDEAGVSLPGARVVLPWAAISDLRIEHGSSDTAAPLAGGGLSRTGLVIVLRDVRRRVARHGPRGQVRLALWQMGSAELVQACIAQSGLTVSVVDGDALVAPSLRVRVAR
jgi:hypothetical protein